MILNRSYTLTSALPNDEVKNNLLGKHVDVHNLDFEVMEKNSLLKVIPHAENEEKFRILPITHLKLISNGNGSKIKVTTKPRRIDAGGPYLLVIFCLFCVLCGISLYLSNGYGVMIPALTITVAGIIVFIVFWFKMQTGYFDYIRKIKKFIKSKI